MTVLEQLLLGAVYVLLVVVGLQRTDIRETRRLLRQAHADRAAYAEERRQRTEQETAWITDQAARLKHMTDDLRHIRETHTP
ncbi:hypothetical protein [Streptosporangium minutum]|uniref:Uncharacterized protein n=1 Tax=Streptosporangium minutum TaxID=569862 RepID=A0A243RVW9_9ACTN|nr:hypothetical protein [Streptosporangium minutum]OUC99334.1 hypothetical protein CA984_03760 [Streptosporangium minutum]